MILFGLEIVQARGQNRLDIQARGLTVENVLKIPQQIHCFLFIHRYSPMSVFIVKQQRLEQIHQQTCTRTQTHTQIHLAKQLEAEIVSVQIKLQPLHKALENQ